MNSKRLTYIVNKKRAFIQLVCCVFFVTNSFIYSQVYKDFNTEDFIVVHFDTTQVSGEVLINDIIIHNSKKTKDAVILRELSFKMMDVIPATDIHEKLKQCWQNLLNTSLFNYVKIEVHSTKPGKIDVEITVEERWYIWPYAAIYYADRNFSSWLKQKDIMRTNAILGVTWNNFRGMNELIKIKYHFGYSQKISLYYNNIFLDRDKKHSIGFDLLFYKQNEIPFQTENNEQVFAKLPQTHIISGSKVTFLYKYRPSLYSYHTFALNHNYGHINDTVIQLNPNYFGDFNKTYQTYGIYYKHIYDKRNDKSYPLTGVYTLFQSTTSYINRGNDSKITQSFFLKINKFTKLANRFYHAAGLTLRTAIAPDSAYYFQSGLGYDRYFVRGFEYYVIDGQDYMLSHNSFKYQILQKKILHLDFIPLKKFNKIHFSIYSDFFTDIGYVNNRFSSIGNLKNDFTNKPLIGYGIGLNLATYYDKVLRLEYSFTNFDMNGFFIHFTTHIN